MNRNLLLLLLVLFIAVIPGCSFIPDKREAEDLMNSYYECIQANDLANINTFYASPGPLQDELRL